MLIAGGVGFERFSRAPFQADDRPVRVTLQRSGKPINVSKTQSILDAVRAAGVEVPASCRAGLMCICVSRAKSETITLDLYPGRRRCTARVSIALCIER